MIVPNIDMLCKITDAILSETKVKDLTNMTVIFDVDENTLKKVNEEFYYRTNIDGEIDNNIDEINIDVGGLKYIYRKENTQVE